MTNAVKGTAELKKIAALAIVMFVTLGVGSPAQAADTDPGEHATQQRVVLNAPMGCGQPRGHPVGGREACPRAATPRHFRKHAPTVRRTASLAVPFTIPQAVTRSPCPAPVVPLFAPWSQA